MGKIVAVCVGKIGPRNVIAMLDENGAVVAAVWASDGGPVQANPFKDIVLHPEYGCFRIA